jgi:hypothetical protein
MEQKRLELVRLAREIQELKVQAEKVKLELIQAYERREQRKSEEALEKEKEKEIQRVRLEKEVQRIKEQKKK